MVRVGFVGVAATSVVVAGLGCTFDTSYEAAWDGATDGAFTDGFLDAQSTDSATDSGGGSDGGGSDTGVDSGSGSDAGSDSGGSTDSAVPMGPFSAPVPVPGINVMGVSDDDPTLTADMLEIFWDSARPGGLGGGDIWTSSRTSVGGPWSPPVNVSAVNTTDGETTPEVSSDGLTLCFSSNRPGGAGGNEIYCTTRGSRSAAWGAPVHVPELGTPDGEFAPTASADGLYMIFSSTRPGVGNFDLYETSRGSAGAPWGAAVLISSLDTVDVETDPFFDSSETVLFFSTDRPGGAGGWDIWIAVRPSSSAPFAPPTPVTELNSTASDSDSWLSPDFRTIYFSSNRNGSTDLFMATR